MRSRDSGAGCGWSPDGLAHADPLHALHERAPQVDPLDGPQEVEEVEHQGAAHRHQQRRRQHQVRPRPEGEEGVRLAQHLHNPSYLVCDISCYLFPDLDEGEQHAVRGDRGQGEVVRLGEDDRQLGDLHRLLRRRDVPPHYPRLGGDHHGPATQFTLSLHRNHEAQVTDI